MLIRASSLCYGAREGDGRGTGRVSFFYNRIVPACASGRSKSLSALLPGTRYWSGIRTFNMLNLLIN